MKLHQLITQYIAFKKALGLSFRSSEEVLRAFGRALGEELDIKHVQVDKVHAFLTGAGPVTSYWYRKYDVLRGFYRYGVSRGYVNAVPLPQVIPKRPERFAPYIYTCEELRRLLDATASYQKHRVLAEPHTLRAILLLLYGAGLRLREALSLVLDDVDLSRAIMTIRMTKFYKSRLVPLGPDLNHALRQYVRRRKADGHAQNSDAPFFVGRTGRSLHPHTFQEAFAHLRDYAGISRRDGARYQPRLHDLRHTFAVHRLTAWYREGKDVQRMLPKLSTYMGHVEIASTQVYLTMTPELLQLASERFEAYARKEVDHD